MSESLELLRNDVKIALSKGALDGEAGIVKMSYFQAYGPTTWLRGIRADLYRHHLVESKRQEGGKRMMQGVSLTEFHRWVARKVQSADPNNFTPQRVGGSRVGGGVVRIIFQLHLCFVFTASASVGTAERTSRTHTATLSLLSAATHTPRRSDTSH